MRDDPGDIPRNRDRDGWDYLEGRGPGGPANVVDFPLSPPPHIATSQRIAAEAGIVATITIPPLAPATAEHAARLFMRAARAALSKFLAGEWLSDEEARYLEALDAARRKDKP
jgi:hypothetical protein